MVTLRKRVKKKKFLTIGPTNMTVKKAKKVKKIINCMDQKAKLNLNDLKINHEARDRKCPHYL